MHIDFLLEKFSQHADEEALIWKEQTFHYDWLLNKYYYWREQLQQQTIPNNAVVIVEADFSPNSIALFLALIEIQAIIVPLTNSVASKRDEFIDIAQGEIHIQIDTNDNAVIKALGTQPKNPLYAKLAQANAPGLVLFSSGSTGKSKAAVHDLSKILTKFETPRKTFRTITFLLYDHIGGVNTLFYTLSNAGCIITIQDRSPDTILSAVEKYQVELLPTSPTFINLLLLSEAYKRHNLSSLKMMTYGTEPMPESTLKRFHQLFPEIQLLQTYGLSELGILRSKSKSSDSLWVKIGGEGFQTRIVDGLLQVKAESAMLGYLNAPSPFTEDGWFNTGDAVEIDGAYLKILGRQSEIINVGGEKVYPAEVESVIQLFDNVAEVTVFGEKNPITGQIVCARIRLLKQQDKKEFTMQLKQFCSTQLESYKIPMKIKLAEEKQYTERFKKARANINA